MNELSQEDEISSSILYCFSKQSSHLSTFININDIYNININDIYNINISLHFKYSLAAGHLRTTNN